MAQAKVTVRRARPDDAEGIAKLVVDATQGRVQADRMAVLERLGARGYFVANTDSLVGFAGWSAENLVARIEDFIVHPVDLRPTAGRELLNHVEDAANDLECEVALLLVPRNAAAAAVTFFESCGYEFTPYEKMPVAWQELAQASITADYAIMVKRLRHDLVRSPIG